MPSPTASDAGSYHHGNLRSALLTQARVLLDEDGPAALSLREIARRAGVAAPSVYHHFANLDAISVALAEEGFTELVARLEGAPANAKGQLAEVGLAYVRFAMDNPGLYRLMFGEGLKTSSAESQTVQKLRERAYERVKTGLRARLPEEEVATGALYLWSLVHGLALLIIDDRLDTYADPEKVIRSVLSLAGQGLPDAKEP
jgi:AcrR family transcriptional regulator